MKLGRAKLILIIAFAGLNIFLGYQLFWPDFGRLTEAAVTSEALRETEQKLAENNYVLEASFDRATRTSDFVPVSPSREIRHELLYDLIRTGVQIEESDRAIYYRADDRLVIIHTSGLLQVFFENNRSSLEENPVDLDENDLTEQVAAILEEHHLLPEHKRFDYLEHKEDGSVILYYYQLLDDKPIYSGQLKVFIDAAQIRAVEIYWLVPGERIPTREMEVIPPTEALKNLVAELGPSPEERSIQKIDLGYYSGEYDAEKWEIPPVWRIVLDNNQYYYINAFTGNLEKEAVIPEQM